MGKALYRKYRSKTLDEVVGQKHITDTLRNALAKNAISHAYLFTGPRGVGKTSVARILAHEINNIPYEEESSHLDIIEIDAASNRRIDEIRDLRDKVHIAPTSAKYKVYIIDEVHMLTREAFNALLKTLEEPPEHVVFILATTESHKVPDTIISRTQQFSFKPIDNENAILHLRMIADEEQLEISDKALELIARHGNGSFRDSISMLDQLAGLSGQKIDDKEVALLLGMPDDEILDNLIENITNADSDNLFTNITKLREHGASPSNISQRLIEKLREGVMEGNSKLSNEKAVKLMKGLLEYTGAHSSFEALEITLLDSIDFNNQSSGTIEKNSEVRNEVIENKAQTEKVPTVIANKQLHEVIKAHENVIVDKNWETVLNALKNTNNTLYGVLRMADVHIIDNKITLTFKFEFHKKQLKSNKNLDMLHRVITDNLGKKHELEIMVKKSDKNKVKTDSANLDKDKVISSVSNIFGGAELLES